MNKLNALDLTALVLVIVGGLNWALVGLFGFNLVEVLFGKIPFLTNIVYTLVGLAAAYLAVSMGNFSRK